MNRAQSAFTLLEVMVALSIIAITLGAIIENTTTTNQNAQYLRDKTIAGWVAQNQISLLRAKRSWTNKLNKQGRVEMAGREWLWKMKLQKTLNTEIRRVDVDVYNAEDETQSLARVTGFVARM